MPPPNSGPVGRSAQQRRAPQVLDGLIAEQRWEPAPGGGWTVPADLHGWRFRVLPVTGGVRVTRTGKGEPATWFVPA